MPKFCERLASSVCCLMISALSLLPPMSSQGAMKMTSRTLHPFGLDLTFGRDVLPANLGAQITLQPLEFVRFGVGGGIMNQGTTNIPVYGWNYTLGYGLTGAFILGSMITLNVLLIFVNAFKKGFGSEASDWYKWGEIRDFYGDFFIFNTIHSEEFIAAYSGGVTFMIPKWPVTPVGGVHISKYESSGIEQLETSGISVAGSLGIELFARERFSAQLGYVYAPRLHEEYGTGYYLNLGVRF